MSLLSLSFSFLPLSLGANQALLHSTAVQEKIAATVSEEVERKVQEKLKQVREDTTALRDQLLRETRSMATVVSGGIQGIEDKVRVGGAWALVEASQLTTNILMPYPLS